MNDVLSLLDEIAPNITVALLLLCQWLFVAMTKPLASCVGRLKPHLPVQWDGSHQWSMTRVIAACKQWKLGHTLGALDQDSVESMLRDPPHKLPVEREPQFQERWRLRFPRVIVQGTMKVHPQSKQRVH